jgi:exodeoxyribonuclease V alpha subunit
VSIDDREITYDYSELDELVHAYAVSIHKSQGSEYPAVVIPILTQHYILLQRNLLYTGVTRGEETRRDYRNQKSNGDCGQE